MTMVKEAEIMSSGSMHLRLEARNGSPAKEYRIESGSVEVRTFDCESDYVRIWSRLTPELGGWSVGWAGGAYYGLAWAWN